MTISHQSGEDCFIAATRSLMESFSMQKNIRSAFRRSMHFSIGILLLTAFITAQKSMGKASEDYTRNVDPFIGVDWGGNTFVGSAIPYGMVKVGPDMQTFDGRKSGFGYSSSDVILRFSHLHLSGAQGKYGNILVMPVTGPLALNDIKSPRTDEINRVGYYAAKLTRYNIKAELTSSRRVGFHRYTFPASQKAHIVIDIAHALGLGTDWQAQKFLGAEIHLISNHEAQGTARFTGGWNRGGEYKVYYDMVLDTSAEATRTWTGSTLSPTIHSLPSWISLGALRKPQLLPSVFNQSWIKDEPSTRISFCQALQGCATLTPHWLKTAGKAHDQNIYLYDRRYCRLFFRCLRLRRCRASPWTSCVEVLFVARRVSSICLIVLVLFLSTSLFSEPAQDGAEGRVFSGYFEEWGVRYAGYSMADLEKSHVASLMTHLIYAFGNVTPGASPSCAIADPSAAWQDASILGINGKPFSGPVYGNFAGMLELKTLHPHLKTLISLGGQAGDVSGFTAAAASPVARHALVTSCIRLFIQGHLAPGVDAPGLFDGFNVDWEFPQAGDRDNFTALLHEFRTQLDELGRSTGHHYILTFDSPANPQKYANIDLKAAAKEVDFLTIDGYDYAAPSEKTTNAHSALYNSPDDPLRDQARAIDDTVQAYLKAGVPASKYTMGMPLYGVGWSGVAKRNHGLYQSAAGEAPVLLADGSDRCPTQSVTAPASGCDTILTPGFATDATLKQLLRRPDAHSWYDSKRVDATLYLSDSRTFYVFDNLRSVNTKTAYIRQHKLRGAYVWALNDDDRDATIIKAIAAGLK